MRRLVVALLLLAATATAAARTQRDFTYPAEQVFPTLVRLLRVDERLKVVEKDAEAGFITFELVDGKRTFRGSAELVKVSDTTTRVVIKIADRPSYMEDQLLERLGVKLREDLP